jgi:hypothetical protein
MKQEEIKELLAPIEAEYALVMEKLGKVNPEDAARFENLLGRSKAYQSVISHLLNRIIEIEFSELRS